MFSQDVQKKDLKTFGDSTVSSDLATDLKESAMPISLLIGFGVFAVIVYFLTKSAADRG